MRKRVGLRQRYGGRYDNAVRQVDGDQAFIFRFGRHDLHGRAHHLKRPNIDGGTWDWDHSFFTATFNSPATFTALKAGTSTITYTVDGASTTYDVTIEEAELPATGAGLYVDLRNLRHRTGWYRLLQQVCENGQIARNPAEK